MAKLDTTFVSIKSDSNPSIYTVTLDGMGRALACTCPAGQRAVPCKHLFRAESRQAYKEAQAVLGVKEATALFTGVVKLYKGRKEGVRAGIEAVIGAAFDPEDYRVKSFVRAES